VNELEIEVSRAGLEHQSLLENLSQFYLYEMSLYVPYIELRDNGLFGGLAYWHEPNHHSFLVWVDGNWAGFALVQHYEDQPFEFDMGDFFILRKYQGKGVGKRVATQLFDLFLGKWRVHQTAQNFPAQAFWQSVIDRYTNGDYTQQYEDRKPIQLFDNSALFPCSS